MCGKPKTKQPAPDPAWKTASAKDTANRGAPEPTTIGDPRRIGGTDAGGTLGGGSPDLANPTKSVLGG